MGIDREKSNTAIAILYLKNFHVFYPSITIVTILPMRFLSLCVTKKLKLCYIKVIIINLIEPNIYTFRYFIISLEPFWFISLN